MSASAHTFASGPSASASSGAPWAPLRRPPLRGVRVPPHERSRLPGGATLTIVPRRDVPLVAFCAVVRGGALGDPAGRCGTAQLTAALLDKGAGARDAFGFADAVEGAGGSFNAVALPEYLCVSGQFLARDQALMLELLAAALLEPHLCDQELGKQRMRHIELIRSAKDSDPYELLGAYGRAFLFPHHPYGRPAGGEERSLASLTRADVLRFHREQVGADRLALVFAGDVDRTALARAVTRAFSGWRAAGAALPPVPDPEPPGSRRVRLIDAPGCAQSYFWLGARGVSRSHPARAALDLANTVYGGRFSSMLNAELRVRAGLTYGASSGFNRGRAAGEFAIRGSTPTGSTARALELTLGTLERLKREGISAEQLESARQYVLGQYPLALETAADWVNAFAELEAYGLSTEYIEGYADALAAVTLDEAHAAIAAAFPHPDDLQLVIIADAARTRARAARYGAVIETALAQPSFSA